MSAPSTVRLAAGSAPLSAPVSISSSRAIFAIPKSRTFVMTAPPAEISSRMLSGLRSRWMTPASWAAWTAEQTCRIRSAAALGGITPRSWISVASGRPATYSSTR